MRIRKGDTVQVRTGKDRGARGEVTRVFPAQSKVIVEVAAKIEFFASEAK